MKNFSCLIYFAEYCVCVTTESRWVGSTASHFHKNCVFPGSYGQGYGKLNVVNPICV